jgi:flagellar protein FlgJ
MTTRAAAPIDFTGLARLRGQASKSTPGAIREAAGQFEALLVQSMLKSMRAVSFGKGLFDNDQSNMYREMFDQQLAVELTHKRGLGLADMITRHLGAEPGKPTQRIPLSARITKAPSLSGSPADFVRQVLPYAQNAARKLGVTAKAVLAHAALETGWGKHLPGRPDGESSFNLVGIKAGTSWQGDTVSVPTLEQDGDVARRVQARFRAYASPEASFEDYAELLSTDPRYAEALARGDDVAGFAHALQEGGYATDPDYARKLEELARGEQMKAALAGLAE